MPRCLLMGIDSPQQDTPARSSALQQRRFLSIHEYLSANLLKTVRMFQAAREDRLTTRSMASVYPRVKSPALRQRRRQLLRTSVRTLRPGNAKIGIG